MDKKPIIFFFTLLLLALILVVVYQIRMAPGEMQPTGQPAQTQTAGVNPHQQEPGVELYGKYCAGCHGKIGEGTTFNPSLYDKKHSLEEITSIIRSGRNNMPPFPKLSDQQVALIAKFVQSLQSAH